MKSSSSLDILQNLLNGDSSSYDLIYKICFPTVESFVRKNKGSVEDAHEIFQDALFQIITRAQVKKLTITSSFEAYLFTVCKNLWRQEIKRKKRVTNLKNNTYVNETQDESVEHNELIHEKKWVLYLEKFNELSENCKLVLTLVYQKISYKEMLDMLPYKSETVIRQRAFKCRKKLSELIKSDKQFKKIKDL